MASSLLYLIRISFKTDGEIKHITEKQNVREFRTTNPALQQILKGLIKVVNKRERKDLQKQLRKCQ